MLTPLLCVVFAVLVAIGTHVVSMYLTAVVSRVRVLAVWFGSGPAVITVRRRGVAFEIRPFPLGGGIAIAGDSASPPGPAANARVVPLSSRPLLVRVLFHLGGAAALVVAGLVLIGPAHGAYFLLDAFISLLHGVVSPSHALSWWEALHAVGRKAGFAPVLGFVLLTYAALNLLPFPSLNGGAALVEILRALRLIGEKTLEKFAALGGLAVVLIWLAWGIAFVRAIV